MIWLRRSVDLNRAVPVETFHQPFYQTENVSHTFIIGAVRNGEKYDFSGTVTGKFINANNQTIGIGTTSETSAYARVENGECVLSLPSGCYAVPGRFCLFIFCDVNGDKTCVYSAIGNVSLTDTGTSIDPGTIIQDVSALITAINTAVSGIPSDYSNLLAEIAPTFSSTVSYQYGQYVWYEGSLYRFTVDHQAGSWNANDAYPCIIASELSALEGDLKGVLNHGTFNWANMATESYPLGWRKGYYKTDGTVDSNSNNYMRSVDALTAPGEAVSLTFSVPDGYSGRIVEKNGDTVVGYYGEINPPTGTPMTRTLRIATVPGHSYNFSIGRFDGNVENYLISGFIGAIHLVVASDATKAITDRVDAVEDIVDEVTDVITDEITMEQGQRILYGNFEAGKTVYLEGTAANTVVHTAGNLIPQRYANFYLKGSGANQKEPEAATQEGSVRTIQQKIATASTGGFEYGIPAGRYIVNADITVTGSPVTAKVELSSTSGSSGRVTIASGSNHTNRVVDLPSDCPYIYAVVSTDSEGNSYTMSVQNLSIVPYGETWNGVNAVPEQITLGADGKASVTSFGGDHFIPATGTVSASGLMKVAEEVNSLKERASELEEAVFTKLPRTGAYEWFTVTVKRPLFFRDENSEGTETQQDETVECVLSLPESYTPTGTPTRLVLACHGSSGHVQAPSVWYNEAWRRLMAHLTGNGYAVFDSNIFDNTASTDARGLADGSPLYVQVLKAAYDYIQEHYNVHAQIFAHGTSMGGVGANTFTQFYPELVLAQSSFAGRDFLRYLLIAQQAIEIIDSGIPEEEWTEAQVRTMNLASNLAVAYGYDSFELMLADHFSHAVGIAPSLSLVQVDDGAIVLPPDREANTRAWINYLVQAVSYARGADFGTWMAKRTVPYKAWNNWVDLEGMCVFEQLMQKAVNTAGSCVYDVITYERYNVSETSSDAHTRMSYGELDASTQYHNMRDQLVEWYRRWE